MSKLADRLAQKASKVGDSVKPLAPNEDAKDTGSKPKTAPGQMFAFREQMMESQEKIAHLELTVSQLREQAASGPNGRILLSELHEVKGRRRVLTPTEYAELKENLKNNPQATAITVRKRAAGGYEIISGHNRVAAYRELGREDILAVIIECDDEQADLTAFYANLMQPSLPEFEKYLGFKERGAKTGMNYTQLASESGLTASYVSLLMSYDDLPKEALDLLSENRDKIGANAAQELAKLSAIGRQKQVLEAINSVIHEGVTQAAAIRTAGQDPTKTTKEKIKPTQIRSGKAIYAEVRGADKVLRISFRSQDEREALQKDIENVIKEHVAKSKE